MDAKGAIVRINNYTLSVPYSNIKNPYINFIYEDAKSDIFVGTREGLYKLDKYSDQFVNLYIDNKQVRGALGPYFLSVARAPDGKYWVGTLGGLLVCNQLEDIQKGNYKWYYSILSDDNSIVDNLISALYFDASGVLWIGTEDGLDKYDPYENQFTLNKDISRSIGNQAPRIRGFAKTYDEKVIVATYHNGLFISNTKGSTPLHNTGKDIASIYSDDGKIFYCGLWDGNILVYNYMTNSSREIKAGFEKSPVFAFRKIRDDSMIVGSFGEGAVILNTKTLQVQTSSKLLPDFQINAIERDAKNNVWFATETGVVKYNINSGKIETYSSLFIKEKGVPHDENVSDVLVDAKGKIWASTRFGLCLYDPKKNEFEPVKNLKELSGKWITDILSDTKGNLWLNINNNNIAFVKSNLKDISIYHVNSGNRLDVFSSSGFFLFNN
jgi:ligand-binding sensor domain-containing protein